MAEIKVTITETMDTAQDLGDAINDDMRQLARQAERLLKGPRSKVPVDSGDLRRSIRVRAGARGAAFLNAGAKGVRYDRLIVTGNDYLIKREYSIRYKNRFGVHRTLTGPGGLDSGIAPLRRVR